MQQKAIKIFIK